MISSVGYILRVEVLTKLETAGLYLIAICLVLSRLLDLGSSKYDSKSSIFFLLGATVDLFSAALVRYLSSFSSMSSNRSLKSLWLLFLLALLGCLMGCFVYFLL